MLKEAALVSAVTVERVLVTPGMAEEWLKLNTNNRALKPHLVAKHVRALLAGKFTDSNDSICFGLDGKLLNGQHRLTAIVRSGISVWMTVQRNMPEESRENMDQPSGRTHGQNRVLSGDVYGIQRSELAVGIFTILTHNHSPVNYERDQIIERHHVGLQWACEQWEVMRRVTRAPVRAALAFAYETAPDEIGVFTERFLTGVGEFRENDPALVLKRTMEHSKGVRDARRSLSVKTLRACQAYLRQEFLSVLPVNENAVAYFAKQYGYDVKKPAAK